MISKLKSFILAFICFIPTVVNAPLTIVYLVISLLGGLHLLNKWKKREVLKSDYFLMGFLLLSIVIYLVGYDIRPSEVGKSKNDFIPYTIFMVTTIFFARSLGLQVFKYVFYFITLEIIIGIIEYLFGIQYIIKPLTTAETEFGSTDILYYNKVYGISAVTSIFAQKIFIGIILLQFLNIKKYKSVFIVILFLGLIITFNRTAIVASLFLVALSFLKHFKKVKFELRLMFSLIFAMLLFAINYYSEIILSQFFRGKEEVDLSGRDVIFENFIIFINDNLIFGNFADKVWMELADGIFYHAHNSYLETLASLGLFLSVFFAIYLIKIIKRSALIYLLPILLYSVFQYGIFWGVSLLDIVFFFIIFSFHNSDNVIHKNLENPTSLIER